MLPRPGADSAVSDWDAFGVEDGLEELDACRFVARRVDGVDAKVGLQPLDGLVLKSTRGDLRRGRRGGQETHTQEHVMAHSHRDPHPFKEATQKVTGAR